MAQFKRCRIDEQCDQKNQIADTLDYSHENDLKSTKRRGEEGMMIF